MKSWILQSVGVEMGEADAVVDLGLRWQPAGSGMVVLAVALVAASAWGYWRGGGGAGPGRRFLLAAIRASWLLLLLALLLEPALVLTVERSIRRTLPVLVDTTESLAMTDGLDSRRIDRINASLARGPGREAIDALAADLDVVLHRITDGGLAPAGGGRTVWADVEPGGDSTALGDAMSDALDRHAGSPLAGMVLMTDGGQNRGLPVGEAAALMERASVPVFAVGVGAADVRDVVVEEIAVREVVLAEDAVAVTVRLGSQGMRGRGGRVVVSLDGIDVAEEVVVFDRDGHRDVRVLVPPAGTGHHALEARFEPDLDAGEVFAGNNAVGGAVRVVDRRLRVLLVDQQPRWEYRFLEALLSRERRVDLDCLLVEADPDLVGAPGSPQVGRFPDRPEELFAYDLVILGDVAPVHLDHDRQVLLREFVGTAGGALVVVAGKRFTPSAYAHAELGRLLPVEPSGDAAAAGAVGEPFSRPVRLVLTDAGEASLMLRLADERDASASLWRDLPAVYWTASVGRAKPAAEVLVVRSDSPAPDGEPDPVMVRHRYGAGTVLFVGTDNLWRWRRNAGDRHYATLWGQIVQHLAGERLLVENPRARLQVERSTWRRGDRVTVHARLFSEDWKPMSAESVPAALESLDDPDPEHRLPVELRPVPGRPGRFRGEFVAGEAGRFRLATDPAIGASLDLTVIDDRREFAQAAMNAGLLADLAERTGGAFLTLDGIGRLPAAITNRTARTTRVVEADLWSSMPAFVLIVLLATIEWIVRRFSDLK